MKILIFEPHPGGHRFEYIARIIPALQELGVETILASSKIGLGSLQFRTHLEALQDAFSIYECGNGPLNAGSVLARARQSWHELKTCVSTVKPDHLYFPDADGVSQVAAISSIHRPLFPTIETEALHFSGGYGYKRNNFLRRIRQRLERHLVTASLWSSYWHVDPWQLAALREHSPSFANRSMLLPDPVAVVATEDRRVARNRLGIQEDGIVLGIAGPMSRRKRLDLLLDAYERSLPRLASDVRLLVAGSLDDPARHLLREKHKLVTKGRIVVLDRYFSADDMELVIPAMDIVVAPYEHHLGSSGIVLRAAAAARPVVTSDAHWLEKTVRTFGLGDTCRINDVSSFSEALVRAVESCSSYVPSDAAKRYLEFQSLDNFTACWTARLRQRLGLSQDPARIEWSWVIEAL